MVMANDDGILLFGKSKQAIEQLYIPELASGSKCTLVSDRVKALHRNLLRPQKIDKALWRQLAVTKDDILQQGLSARDNTPADIVVKLDEKKSKRRHIRPRSQRRIHKEKTYFT